MRRTALIAELCWMLPLVVSQIAPSLQLSSTRPWNAEKLCKFVFSNINRFERILQLCFDDRLD